MATKYPPALVIYKTSIRFVRFRLRRKWKGLEMAARWRLRSLQPPSRDPDPQWRNIRWRTLFVTSVLIRFASVVRVQRAFMCTTRCFTPEALLAPYLSFPPPFPLHVQRKLPHHILGVGMQEAGTQLGEHSLFGYVSSPTLFPLSPFLLSFPSPFLSYPASLSFSFFFSSPLPLLPLSLSPSISPTLHNNSRHISASNASVH